jgi:hypothetical protein
MLASDDGVHQAEIVHPRRRWPQAVNAHVIPQACAHVIPQVVGPVWMFYRIAS